MQNIHDDVIFHRFQSPRRRSILPTITLMMAGDAWQLISQSAVEGLRQCILVAAYTRCTQTLFCTPPPLPPRPPPQ